MQILALLLTLAFPQHHRKIFAPNNLAFVQVCLGNGSSSSTAVINIGASSSFCYNGGTAANGQG